MNDDEHKDDLYGDSSIENVIIDEGNENKTTDPDPDPDMAHVSLGKYEKTKLEIDPSPDNNGQPSGQFNRNPPDSEMTTIPTTVSNLFVSQCEHSPQVDESENSLILAPSFDKKEIKQETCPSSPATSMLVFSKDTKSVNALSNKETSLVCPFYKPSSNDCYLYHHKNAVDIPPSTDGRKYWMTSK